jgi:energy-coupling factor transport system substrate-specific component
MLWLSIINLKICNNMHPEPAEKLNYQDLLFVIVISVVLGIIWIFYGMLYNVIFPILKPLNLNGLLQGFWYIGGGFLGIILRKKYSALLGELIPSLIELTASAWGIYNLLYGLAQGIISEIVFRIYGYKNATIKTMIIANSLAAIIGSIVDYILYGYSQLSIEYNVVTIISQVISTILFSILLYQLLKTLKKLGYLKQYNIPQ